MYGAGYMVRYEYENSSTPFYNQGCGAGQSPAPAPILLAPEPAPNYWLPAPGAGSRLLAPSSGSQLRLLAPAPKSFISFHTYFFTNL